MKKLLLALTLIFSISISSYGQKQEEQSEEEQIAALIASMPVHVGEKAPDFSLENINGVKVNLSDYSGKWVLLDFWGSWCKYCIMAFPNLKEAYTEYHPLGFEIIGIDNDDSEETWKDAVAKHELPWVNLYNPDKRDEGIRELYGIKAYPTQILIDPDGIISAIYLGEDPALYDLLEEIYTL